MSTTVTALLVSHDGRRWLPVVLDGLAGQTRPPDRVVAVDTGSTDTGPDLLRERLGADAVLSTSASSGFGAAVATGLAALPAAAPDEWVWLLHDDSTPAPDALERLVGFAEVTPSASALGPKLREWPSLRRIVEVGVTVSGSGRRETGLESGEYDQGQHDEPRDVLAVNTAGMLVRRSALESLGLDPRLPFYGDDLDLGWRAARAGHRVVVVSGAVVFHAEAARRGVRRTPVTGDRRRSERAAAAYVLLANGPAATLPLRALRLLLGCLLRAVGLLLLRAPGEAVDELVALGSVLLRPGALLAARRDRRGTASVPHREVRHLLAPAWLPYRHGLDAVTDLAAAVADETRARVQGRRLLGPVSWVFALLLVAALAAARGLVGGGTLSGGALLPAPANALDWWRTYLGGSAAPAAPYLVPLALLGTLLLNQASLVLDLVFLAAVPLAAWGGYRFLRRVTSSVPASLCGAAAYAAVPVVTGAVQEGRLGTVAATLLLPWVAHAAVFLRAEESPDRRARAAWRTALLLALLTAFAPLAWPVAAALGVLAVVLSPGRRRAAAGAALVPLAASLVLLLPWSVATWSRRGADSWLFEAGLPVRHGTGSPGWLLGGVLVVAAAALVPASTRRAVLRAWVVVVVALAASALLSHGTFDQPLWPGFALVLAAGAALTAASLAGAGLRPRRPLAGVLLAAAVLAPVLSLGWWVWTGSGDGPLHRGPASALPAYIGEAVRDDPTHGVLLVRGSREAGLSYVLLRRDGARTGDDSVSPSAAEQSRVTSYVQDLAGAADPGDVTALARAGVGYVYAPAPADPTLVANLDSLRGVSPGSATAGARAWQLEPVRGGARPLEADDPARPWLLAVQGLAVVVALVLAAPSRKGRR